MDKKTNNKNNIIFLGRINGNSQSRSIYDSNGLCPTLTAGMSQGNTVPYIIENKKTKNIYNSGKKND